MFNPSQLDFITQKLIHSLPDEFRTMKEELNQQFKLILQSACSELNLVTRDEFDIQTRVLARTREKVEQLQQTLDTLTEKP